MAPLRTTSQRTGFATSDSRPSSANRASSAYESYASSRLWSTEPLSISVETTAAAEPVDQRPANDREDTAAARAAAAARCDVKVEEPLALDRRYWRENRHDWIDTLPVDRAWQHRYNRNLFLFANSVSSLLFSKDARWLVSGTGSGDLKVWDTAGWFMAQTLKGCKKEEPSSIIASPSQVWLVSVQPSALHVYRFKPPFRQEQVVPAMVCPGSREASSWCCAAFSPGTEVENSTGRTGENNYFAALSRTHLCVFDYSSGWTSDTPRRTHSILRYAKPTAVTYTPCQAFIIIAYDNGHMHIWKVNTLTLYRKLSAHDGSINCMDMSPTRSEYGCRLATVGQDFRLRLWHSYGWYLEEERKQRAREEAGIIRCAFSPTGNWLLTISRVLCIWRVCLSEKGRVWLCLHQRVDSDGCVDGLYAANFSSSKDILAVGSRDGALSVWTRFPGLPPDFPYEDDEEDEEEEEEESATPRPADSWTSPHDDLSDVNLERLSRPMRRVCALDVASDAKRKVPSNGPEGWYQKWQLRSTTTAVPHPMLGVKTLSSSGSAPGLRAGSGATLHSALATNSRSGAMHSSSSSDLRRWTCRHSDLSSF